MIPTQCVIITAGCFHRRRNETWDTDIDTEQQLCPLYTIIPHNSGGREKDYDWEGTRRGTCIGTFISGAVNIFEGNECTGMEHGIGVLSVWP